MPITCKLHVHALKAAQGEADSIRSVRSPCRKHANFSARQLRRIDFGLESWAKAIGDTGRLLRGDRFFLVILILRVQWMFVHAVCIALCGLGTGLFAANAVAVKVEQNPHVRVCRKPIDCIGWNIVVQPKRGLC